MVDDGTSLPAASARCACSLPSTVGQLSVSAAHLATCIERWRCKGARSSREAGSPRPHPRLLHNDQAPAMRRAACLLRRSLPSAFSIIMGATTRYRKTKTSSPRARRFPTASSSRGRHASSGPTCSWKATREVAASGETGDERYRRRGSVCTCGLLPLKRCTLSVPQCSVPILYEVSRYVARLSRRDDLASPTLASTYVAMTGMSETLATVERISSTPAPYLYSSFLPACVPPLSALFLAVSSDVIPCVLSRV